MCTSLLHLFRQDHVTWVTSWAAHRLLYKNPHIDSLLIFDSKVMSQLSEQAFDLVINLEKDSGICVFFSQLKAKKRYGFYFDDAAHDVVTVNKSTRYLLIGQENQKGIKKNSFEILFEAVGERWQGEGVILPPRSRVKITHDIGFNHAVGPKWPTKAWPKVYWEKLEKMLRNDFSISWQQGFKNLDKYTNWIDSCSLLVTGDSLCQAIAQGLGKNVVTLFGPTNYWRMMNVPQMTVLHSKSKCPHLPCYLPHCKYDRYCMEEISPEEVADECRRQFVKVRTGE